MSLPRAEPWFGFLVNPVRRRWAAWLDRRIPSTRHVVLDQKRIFIFPTRMGFGFLLTAFLLFLAGVNYDNSLILNFSFFLGSLFVVTILQTFSNLSGLVIAAAHTEPAFAGGEARFNLYLGKSRKRDHCAVQLRWSDFESDGHNLLEAEKIPAQMLIKVNKRGVFRPGRLYVTSVYPLGLVRAWTWIALDMECLVFPKPIACEMSTGNNGSTAEGKVVVPDGKDDFDSLRMYQETDPLSTVDWKAFARTQQMYTKRFHGLQSDVRWLSWDVMPASNVELKLSQLCYWVMEYSRKNMVFGLRLPGRVLEPESGPEHQRRCLEALARF
ncbi:MAG: DUF58 domain-containing protein [Gammaproteobacteria bacterium]